jgi:hypothetical protein
MVEGALLRHRGDATLLFELALKECACNFRSTTGAREELRAAGLPPRHLAADTATAGASAVP